MQGDKVSLWVAMLTSGEGLGEVKGDSRGKEGPGDCVKGLAGNAGCLVTLCIWR